MEQNNIPEPVLPVNIPGLGITVFTHQNSRVHTYQPADFRLNHVLFQQDDQTVERLAFSQLGQNTVADLYDNNFPQVFVETPSAADIAWFDAKFMLETRTAMPVVQPPASTHNTARRRNSYVAAAAGGLMLFGLNLAVNTVLDKISQEPKN